MKKAPKIKYGIEIVKPWSKEMYNHNDKVANEIRSIVEKKWKDAYKAAEADYDTEGEDEDYTPEGFEYADWQDNANIAMMDLQEAVIVVGYGSGFEMHKVDEDFNNELENAAYWRLNEIAEELEIELTCQFVGLK
jgi:hypothetical protein